MWDMPAVCLVGRMLGACILAGCVLDNGTRTPCPGAQTVWEVDPQQPARVGAEPQKDHTRQGNDEALSPLLLPSRSWMAMGQGLTQTLGQRAGNHRLVVTRVYMLGRNATLGDVKGRVSALSPCLLPAGPRWQ